MCFVLFIYIMYPCAYKVWNILPEDTAKPES